MTVSINPDVKFPMASASEQIQEEMSSEEGPFSKLLDYALQKSAAQEKEANQAVVDLATGKTDSVHDVMLSVAKADLTFRLLMEIRNRLTEGLQEILRMQV